MLDLLTTDEDNEAAAQGWALAYVYDAASKKLAVRLIPSFTHARVKTAETATRVVVELARLKNDQLAARALRLVMAGMKPKTKPARKARTK